MQTHIDVSIPLLSGPVLNVVPVRFCDVAHCLNPFAFRASAEPPFGPRIEGGGRRLNPFAFRASAELLVPIRDARSSGCAYTCQISAAARQVSRPASPQAPPNNSTTGAARPC